MEDFYLGLNRAATFPISIMKRVLILMGDVDIGLIPATISPIT